MLLKKSLDKLKSVKGMTNEECRILNLQMLSMRQASKVGEKISWLGIGRSFNLGHSVVILPLTD